MQEIIEKIRRIFCNLNELFQQKVMRKCVGSKKENK
jgi:hypothetical protein